MEDKTLIILTTLICITLLECVALLCGFDGALLNTVIAALAGLAGFTIKAKLSPAK